MSGSASIGALGAARRLVGLRLRRGLNQMQVSWQIMRRKPVSGKKRTATPGKARLGWLLAALIGVSMLFTVSNLSYMGLSNMIRALGSVEVATEHGKTRQAQTPPKSQMRRLPLPPAAGSTFPTGVLQGVALELCILLAAAFLLSLGSGELAKPDWDIEWLVTLPVSLGTLLAVRIAERTLLGGAVFLLWPFLAMVAWEAGYSVLASVALAGLAALPMLAVTATLRTIIDTGLRLSVSPGTLRNLQAVIGVSAIVFLYLGMSPGTSATSYVIGWAPALPDWAFWLPPGLATTALTATDKGTIGVSLAALALQGLAFAATGVLVMMRQLRYGVVGSGARESGRRPAAKPAPAPAAAGATPDRRWLLTPVQARELRLLARDRNFLVQSLVMPVVIIGAQFWFTGGGLFDGALSTPTGLAVIAFTLAAYAMMFSAFQTLNTEGNALWILYSVPRPIERVLREKALLWGIVCLVYPLATFAFAAANGRATWEMLGLAPIVLLGVPIFAVVATALGVFASDPLEQIVQRRIRPSYTYLYAMLAALYVYALFAGSVWQRAGLMVLTALLALALWQKARDHLPYLLDPTASPPARVSLSDGMIAAMLFFVGQGIVLAIFALNGEKPTGRVLLIAFSIAGATAFLLMRFVFARVKAQGVPRIFGPGYGRALVWGAAGGVLAGLAAVAYLLVARHTPLLEGARDTVVVGVEDQLDQVWIAVLAVVAAPIFEEFIFRGLIFGGLRRTQGLIVSLLASAAIFALVHPPFSVIPVFGLGIAAALVYERTRMLIAPIAVHAVYNAIAVGLQYLPGW